MPKRIQRQRSKGWKMPANAVYVGRPTKWGNPWKVGDHIGYEGEAPVYADIHDCLLLFHCHATDDADPLPVIELRGKDLACWCRPGQLCHADVLLELANAPLAHISEVRGAEK